MRSSVTGTYRHRIPWTFYPASYLEKLPSIAGLVGSGTVLTVRPELWPGAWAWLLIGPLLLARTLAPAVTRMTFHWDYSARELRVSTGLLQRRFRTIPWASVRTVDSQAPWSFRLFGLCRVEALQAGEENTRIVLPAVNGTDLARLSEFWQAAAPALPTVVHDPPPDPHGGTLIYKSKAGDLLVASFAYGQFAVVGAGAVLGLVDMLDTMGLVSLAVLSSLGPVLLAVVALAATVLFGFLLTFLRYAGFEARTHLQGGVAIRYGLLSKHERFLDSESIAGLVLQRNPAEMLLGRIRLSLLTADSAAQLGANLILPSLPMNVVDGIAKAAFGDRTPSNAAAGSRLPVLLSSIAWLTATFGIPALVMAAVAGTTDHPAYAVPAAGALTLGVVYGLGRALASRFSLEDSPELVTLTTTHISQRRTSISMPAIHFVTVSGFSAVLRMVRIHFYAGMPRRLSSVLFTTEDMLTIQRRLAELSPSVALQKRERTRGRD
jgi:putative membrane protein